MWPLIASQFGLDSDDLYDYIMSLLSGFFRTHRPDEADLPEGTHWLGGDYSNGVIRCYWHNGVAQYPWTGEVIATIADDFPVANWSYHHQQIMPALGITADGAVIFHLPETWERCMADPDWIDEAQLLWQDVHAGYDAIGNNVARNEAGKTKDITEMRGTPWPDMVAQMRYYALAASAHGIVGGLPMRKKLISLDWYGMLGSRLIK